MANRSNPELHTTFTTLQWNIGGGMIPRPGADITLTSSYTVDGFDHIANVLRTESPDIATMQETHESIIPELAHELGYAYWFNHTYSPSHIEAGQNLGLGVLSRFPICTETYEQFFNPQLTMPWEDGTTVTSADKGQSTCEIILPNAQLTLKTQHVLPFRQFSIDPLSTTAQPVISDVAQKLQSDGDVLIQGDFNINSPLLAPYFPKLFAAGMQEIEVTEPTTPKGRRYDHVLYKGLSLLTSRVISSVDTDHYPAVSKFSI